jgi:predicted Ser/Thr protein kinase
MDKLQKEILDLATTWNPHKKIPKASVPYELEAFITNIIMYKEITNLKEWKRYFKVVKGDPSKIYGGCFCNSLKEGKVLGNGYFGEVILTEYPCKQYGRVAIKIEPVKLDRITLYQYPKYVHKSVRLANKASRLGLSPTIYETFLCVHKDKMMIIKIMEYVEGTSMMNAEWKSEIQHRRAKQELLKQIRILNHHGIIHTDLHEGNVMVDTQKAIPKVTIVDFDRSTDELEVRTLEMELHDKYISDITNYIGSIMMKKLKQIPII